MCVIVPPKIPKSDVWKFFIRTSEGGRCNICQQVIKTSGTTNLRFHLIRSHPKIQFQMKNKANTDTTDATNSSTKRRKVMVRNV